MKRSGADKAYDVAEFVRELRRRKVTPHMARDVHLTKTGKRRRSAVDRRTTRHAGYPLSQRIRKRVEEVFGWMKTTGVLRQTRHRGTARVQPDHGRNPPRKRQIPANRPQKRLETRRSG